MNAMKDSRQDGKTAYPILLFDGECAFCASSVRFILSHEQGPVLCFAPRKSPAGVDLCARHGIDPESVKSMILIRDQEVLTHGEAVLAVAGYLKSPWSLASLFRVIPRWLRDGVYGFISRNRQRLSFGNTSCHLPREEWRERFLG
jgi:predicted DCC family thiol-disulfide oxidoreductase YuxK